MNDLEYRALIWLTYRLAANIAVGIPFVLLIWATIRNQRAIVRLLSIYWKISSLFFISMILLIGGRPIGYLTSFVSPLIMMVSIWFWVDINEELEDLPAWSPLPLTVRIWRWTLSGFALITSSTNLVAFSCINSPGSTKCNALLEAPKAFHQIIEKLFNFLFGATWTEPLATFFGYLALIIYIVGILQWFLIKVPKQGRIAGDF